MHQQQTSNAPESSNLTSSCAHCTSEANDADLHARNLTNWQQEYDQVSGGRFYGRIDEIRLDGMQVFKEHTSQSLRQQCNVWPDAIWLGISADAADCRINGLEVAANQIMCRPGACDFELMTPDDFDIYGLVIRTDALLAAAENDELDLQGLSLNEHPRLTIPAQELAHVRNLLNQLVAPDTPDLHQRLHRDLILRTLLDLLKKETPAKRPATSYAHRKAVVDKVKAWMELNQDAPLTITELCELTHTSRRTLQYSFESILGISPLKFLKTARLNQVRRSLLASENQERPIASIAADWGFWHPGQFGQDYKKLFGEMPSETVSRAELILG
ncbi:MAG: helix-turn-helix domain-containing protein [Pseudomonadota bacterium]|nr:helix-turn-helix domain-containing protein [Pseudomonadota bacterium]